MAQVKQYRGGQLNPSERKVVDWLKGHLPEEYTLYTSVHLLGDRSTSECEIICVAPHAIYAIEVKNAGGKILVSPQGWKVAKTGFEFFGNDPLVQASNFAKKLKGRLRRFNAQLDNVYVQHVLCFARDEALELYLVDSNGNQQKLDLDRDTNGYHVCRKYTDVPEFIQNPDNLDSLRSQVITHYYRLIDMAIKEGFYTPNYIGDYQITSGAWFTDRYRAYYACHPGNGQTANNVLLKVYRPPENLDVEGLAKFYSELDREINALRKLSFSASEPGKETVLTLLDSFTDEKTKGKVIVIEDVKGFFLENLMQSNILSLRHKYQIAAQLCRGLAFIHRQNVVHRNLHPANLIYDKSKASIRFLNFDYAKFTDGSQPTILMTDIIDPRIITEWAKSRKYQPAEIILTRDEVDVSRASMESDKYALGIILWEMFTGQGWDVNIPVKEQILRSVESLNNRVLKIIEELCAPAPEARKRVDLVDAAGIFHDLSKHPNDPSDRSMPVFTEGSEWKGYRFGAMTAHTFLSRTYLAQEIQSNRKVVIKFLIASEMTAGEELERVKSILQFPDVQAHSAVLLDSGFLWLKEGEIVQDGASQAYRVGYQVFEYIEGDTLQRLVEVGGLSGKDVLQRYISILKAVKPLHDHGYIHQDIKPDNLIQASDGTIKIIDFGLTRRAGSTTYPTGFTFGYTPPAILPGADGQPGARWTFAGDIHSITRVCLALLCGEDRSRGGPLLDWGLVETKVGREIAGLLEKQVREIPGDATDGACQSIDELLRILEPEVEKFGQHVTEEELTTVNPLEQLEKIIEDLEHRKSDALEAGNYDEYQRIATDIGLLNNWAEHEYGGDCPVDLTGYGIQPVTIDREQHEGVESREEGQSESEESDQPQTPQPIAENPEAAVESAEQSETSSRPSPSPEMSHDSPAEAPKPGDGKDASAPVEPVLDEVERKRRDQQEIQRLLSSVQQAVEDKDYSLAEEGLKSLEVLDSGNKEAHILRQELKERKKAKEIADLIQTLDEEKDVKRLGERIEQAKDLLIEEKNPDLLDAKNRAYQRYEDLKRSQGQATTQDAMREYAKSKETINKIALAILDGQRTWFYRDGTFKNIEDVSKEVKDELIRDATRLALDVLKKADYHMAGSSRKPHTALGILKDAFEFSEMDSEAKRRLEETQATWEGQADQYDAAELELQKAVKESNPMVRLQYLRQARSLYPYHSNLVSLQKDYIQAAVRYMVRECEMAAERAEIHLQREEQEAIESITTGNKAELAKVFSDARAELQNAKVSLSALEDEVTHLSTDLQSFLLAAVRKLDEKSDRITARETRRHQISIRYSQISVELQRDGNIQLAKQIYLETEDDLKRDPVIALLWPKIEGSFSDAEHLEEGRKAVTSGNWERAIEECEKVRDPNLQTEKERLRGLSLLNKKRNLLLGMWSQADYEQAGGLVEEIYSFPTIDSQVIALRDSIITQLDLDGKRIQLQEMRTVNDENRIVPRMQQLKSDLPALNQPDASIDVLGKGDKNLERVIGIYRRVVELEQLKSSFQGQLHGWKRRLEAALLDQLLRQLEAMAKNENADHKRAFHFAEILWQNNLTEESYQTELCRDAILSFYEDQNQPLKERQDWKGIIQNWEKAYTSFGKEMPSIRQRLNGLRHEYLLILLDNSLAELNQQEVQRILLHQVNPCVFNEAVPFVYDVEADKELQDRQMILKIMEDADTLFRERSYEPSVTHIQEKRETLPETIQSRYAACLNKKVTQLKRNAIEILRPIARDIAQPLTERTYAYARILFFDPTDMDAETWLRNNAIQVRVELGQKIEAGAQLVIGLESVKSQIVVCKDLQANLQAFRSVCETLAWRSIEEVNQAILNVEDVLQKLYKAENLLKTYSPTGPGWRGALKTGHWEEVDDTKDVLGDILDNEHQEVRALGQRFEEAKRDRANLQLWKSDLETAFGGENFDQGLKRCDEIDTLLFRYTGHHIDDAATIPGIEEFDPFCLFDREWRLFDPFLMDYVFFYPSPMRQVTIRSLLLARAANLKEWEQYKHHITRCKNYIGDYPAGSKPLTLKMKEDLEVFLDKVVHDPMAREIHGLEEIPQHSGWSSQLELANSDDLPEELTWLPKEPEAPKSKKALVVCEAVKSVIAELKTQLLQGRQEWKQYHLQKDVSFADLDALACSFRQGRETLEKVDDLIAYFQDSHQEKVLNFLRHLRMMAIEPVSENVRR